MKLPQTSEQWLEFYSPLLSLPVFTDKLNELATLRFAETYHGDFPLWRSVVESLPEFSDVSLSLNTQTVGTMGDCPLTSEERNVLKNQLQLLHPWRKGPFDLAGIFIDTEWRSDWKWERLEKAISPLKGRTVLDIGTGSGYHVWRMLGAGARLAFGIEPMLLYVMQFLTLQHFARQKNACVFPMSIEDMPTNCSEIFDTIFSMGVLYHRKNPLEHLEHIRQWLRDRGEIVLETLIIEGDANTVLVPDSRYAQMRNVWFLPSALMLEKWLKRLSFTNIRLINITRTSIDEQRSTEWMRFESLKDFLNPNNLTQTIEGYPAPCRAIFIAEKK